MHSRSASSRFLSNSVSPRRKSRSHNGAGGRLHDTKCCTYLRYTIKPRLGVPARDGARAEAFFKQHVPVGFV